MMHFFGANFYLDNSIGLFEQTASAANATANSASDAPVTTPSHGLLLIPEFDFQGIARAIPTTASPSSSAKTTAMPRNCIRQ